MSGKRELIILAYLQSYTWILLRIAGGLYVVVSALHVVVTLAVCSPEQNSNC